jgi:hypothetical protein
VPEFKTMKKGFRVLMLSLPVLLGSCASDPPAAFHKSNPSLLVIDSLDNRSCQVVAPFESAKMDNSQLLDKIKTLEKSHAVIVIVENYHEAKLGPEFRDRSFPLFFCLRTLGYEHIVFVQGKGFPDPDGLLVLAEYN